MAKRRIQVESGIPAGTLAAPARPVDTFVQPTDGVKLEQLAQGLATLAPGLGHLSDVVAKRDAETKFAEGEAHARQLSESAASFRDAVASGAISPNQSPWFMAGLKEQFGRLAADRMNFEFQVAAVQDEGLQTTTDAADFDSFYTEFRDSWMKNNLGDKDRDAYFEKGFGHKADAYLADNQRTFASQLAGRVVKVSGDGHFSEVMNNVMVEFGRGTPVTTIGAALTALNDEAINQRGMMGKLVNERTVDAVVAAARRQNDPTILEILDHVQSNKPDHSGKRPALSSTRYGADKVEEATNNISAEIQNKNNVEHSEQQRLQTRAVNNIMQGAWAMIEQTGGKADLTVFRTQMNAVAPEKVPMLYQLQDAFTSHELVDDPAQVASAFRRVNVVGEGESYTTLEDAAALVGNKQISLASFRNLVNDIQERDKVGIGRWSEDPALKVGTRDMERMFVAELGIDNPKLRRLSLEAKDEFITRYIAWRKGAGKGVEDPTAFINRTRNEIFARMTDRSSAVEYDQTPKAILGPTLPDPAKELVTDASNIQTLAREYDEISAGGRNAYSPLSLDILRRYNITKAGVKEFVAQQRRLLNRNALTPPADTTQQ